MRKIMGDHDWTEDEIEELKNSHERFQSILVKGNVKIACLPECSLHGAKMFDDSFKEYYCPVCES